MHPKIKLEIVVSNDYIQPAIQAIIASAQTGEMGEMGEMGDGKIFVYDVLEAYNIRTGIVVETIDELNR